MQRLEPYEGKLSRTVLRGGIGSNVNLLPDQTVENKQRFISQIMTSKSPVRSCEDIDGDALSYAEIKALCAGNPLIKEKMDLDVSVAKLKILKSNHANQQYQIEDSVLKFYPESIRKTENRVKGYESDLGHLKSCPVTQNFTPMIVKGEKFTEKEAAGKALIEACKGVKPKETVDVGSYNGFDMAVSYDSFNKVFRLELKREMTYSTTLGSDPHGNITRINNVLDNISKQLENGKSQLEDLNFQLKTAKGELGKPFLHEAELNQKMARLSELNISLNLDAGEGQLAADKFPAKHVADQSEKVADKPPKKLSIHERMELNKAKSKLNATDKNSRKSKENEI